MASNVQQSATIDVLQETPMNVKANYLLYRGIKNLLRCDEAEVVEEIARYVISQHASLRLVSRQIGRAHV